MKPGELVVLRNWDVERFQRCEIAFVVHTEFGPLRTGAVRGWIQQR